ncbi:hypothetical protein V6N13_112174 [Hibiscus sabdariffa]
MVVYSKQAGVVETSGSFSVEPGSEAVDGGNEASRSCESAVAEREEIPVVASGVSALVEEESAVLSVPGIVEIQENVEIESKAVDEEEHVSIADRRDVLVDDEPGEEAVEQGSVGVDHDQDKQLGLNGGSSSVHMQIGAAT